MVLPWPVFLGSLEFTIEGWYKPPYKPLEDFWFVLLSEAHWVMKLLVSMDVILQNWLWDESHNFVLSIGVWCSHVLVSLWDNGYPPLVIKPLSSFTPLPTPCSPRSFFSLSPYNLSHSNRWLADRSTSDHIYCSWAHSRRLRRIFPTILVWPIFIKNWESYNCIYFTRLHLECLS